MKGHHKYSSRHESNSEICEQAIAGTLQAGVTVVQQSRSQARFAQTTKHTCHVQRITHDRGEFCVIGIVSGQELIVAVYFP